MKCTYCDNHGGALATTACPICGRVSAKNDPDTHLTAPCDHCNGDHALIYCATFNHAMGMEPLYGYEV